MNKAENQVIETQDNALRTITKEVAITQIRNILKFTHRDLGIHEPLTDYDQIRFMDFMRKYYGFLNLHDITLMFELYQVDKLPGSEHHYGKWSARFYLSVVKSYVLLKAKIRAEQMALLPEAKITKEQIQNINNEFKISMIDAFDKLKETGQINNSALGLAVYKFWYDKGHLPEPTVTEQDQVVAIKELMEEVTFFHEITPSVKAKRASLLSHYRAVRELYQKWIADGENIRQHIKHG